MRGLGNNRPRMGQLRRGAQIGNGVLDVLDLAFQHVHDRVVAEIGVRSIEYELIRETAYGG